MFNDGPDTQTFFLTLQYEDGEGETHYDKVDIVEAPKGEWVQLSNSSFEIPSDARNLYLYVETEEDSYDFFVDDVIGAVSGTVIEGAGKPEIIEVIKGDINSDGIINVLDVVEGRKGLINGFNSKEESKSADADGNGKYEINDLVLIQKYVLGIIDSFE